MTPLLAFFRYMRFIAPFMSDFSPGYSNERLYFFFGVISLPIHNFVICHNIVIVMSRSNSNVFYLIELSPSDAALIPRPPTPNSTSSNSSFPTASPSSSPSLSPSLPTERPTIAPSAADSNSTNATNATGGVESVAPTQSPSASSSQAPSQAPSPSPSVSPASWPGVAPNLVEEVCGIIFRISINVLTTWFFQSRLIIQWDKVLLYEPSQYSSGSPTDVSQRPFTFQGQ